MWTVERITELCVEYCGRCGVEFNSPVVINSRLTTTLGRCTYRKSNSLWNPTKIEISKRLLETSTDHSIEEVIAHECAHYVTCAITHEDHGHDVIFRFYCDMIGTTNSSTTYDNLERVRPNEEIYKYTLYCSECGRFLTGKSRACKMTMNPRSYITKCCGASLKVLQNW